MCLDFYYHVIKKRIYIYVYLFKKYIHAYKKYILAEPASAWKESYLSN